MTTPKEQIEGYARLGEWWINGERGLSSEAVARAATGATDGLIHYPLDPDDLRRCLLLEEVAPRPFAVGMGRLTRVSGEWRALAGAWGELGELLRTEIGADLMHPAAPMAPKTYDRMKEVLNGAAKHIPIPCTDTNIGGA